MQCAGFAPPSIKVIALTQPLPNLRRGLLKWTKMILIVYLLSVPFATLLLRTTIKRFIASKEVDWADGEGRVSCA